MPERSTSCSLHRGEQVGGVHGGQPTVALPDGRADGFDDDDLTHGPTVDRPVET